MQFKQTASGVLLHHNADVTVGRRGGRKFRPEIQSKKFKDSVYLNIAHEDAESGGAPEWEGNKLTTRVGKRKHRMYELSNADLEYEIEYDKKPDSLIETLYMDFPDGLDFFLQPELTPEEAIRMTRPDDVIGSYAVYWKHSGRYLNKAGIEQINYETGKFAHLYRPKVIAADGQERWCEQIIDPVAKTLTIIMPEEFMANAAYPVILDPTFGFTSVGASNDASGANLIFGTKFAMGATDAVSVDSMSLYVRSVTTADAYNLGIYADSSNNPGSKVCQCTAGTTAAADSWQTLTGPGTQALSASTNYWIIASVSSNTGIKYDTVSAGSGEFRYKANTYNATMPSPFPAGYSSTNTYRMSAYVTYTEPSLSNFFMVL